MKKKFDVDVNALDRFIPGDEQLTIESLEKEDPANTEKVTAKKDRKPAEKKKTKTLHVYMTEKEYNTTKQMADDQDISVNKLIGIAVKEYIKKCTE